VIDDPGAEQNPIPAAQAHRGGPGRSCAAAAAYFIEEAIISQER
jgi:hypothetical protein